MFLLSFGSTSSPRISFISCIRIMHSPFFIKLILFFNFCDIMLYYNNSHGQNEVNQVKKKTLVPLIIFLLGICLVGFIVYKTDTHEKNERHITAQLNATTYGERIKNEQDLHYFMCFSHVFPLHFIRFIFPKSGPDFPELHQH